MPRRLSRPSLSSAGARKRGRPKGARGGRKIDKSVPTLHYRLEVQDPACHNCGGQRKPPGSGHLLTSTIPLPSTVQKPSPDPDDASENTSRGHPASLSPVTRGGSPMSGEQSVRLECPSHL